jgi:hypothetical protein
MNKNGDIIAAYGKFEAGSSLIFGGLICLCFYLLGFYLIYTGLYLVETIGTITNVICNNNDCTLTIKYNINNKDYEQTISSSNNTVNNKIKIYYNSNNFNSIYSYSGFMFIAGGIGILLFCSIIIYSLYKKYYFISNSDELARVNAAEVIRNKFFQRTY